MTITISKRAEELLRAKAAARGQEPNVYIETLIARDADPLAGMTFKPLEQFVAEQREKHGLPDDWGTKPVALSDEEWKTIETAYAVSLSGVN